MGSLITAITDVQIIDGRGGVPVANGVILVENGRITQLGSQEQVAIPEVATVYSVPGCTAVPGLIDLHVHMTDLTQGREFGDGELSERALLGARNAAKALENGVLTVRDVGSVSDTAILFKKALADNLVPGPRLFSSGQYLAVDGGHGTEIRGGARVVKSPEDAVKAVRERIRAGADFIKVMNNSQLNVAEFTQPELEAIVTEAHRLGTQVACHASVLGAVKSAVKAGVHTVEHGCELDEEVVSQMVAEGTVLVPTLIALAKMQDHLDQMKVDDQYRRAAVSRWAAAQSSFQLALQAGVRLATGTDAGMWPLDFDDLAGELEWFVKLGATPMQAIQAATIEGARVLGIDDEIGLLAPGYVADIVIVADDPLRDISNIRKIHSVFQNGRLVHHRFALN